MDDLRDETSHEECHQTRQKAVRDREEGARAERERAALSAWLRSVVSGWEA